MPALSGGIRQIGDDIKALPSENDIIPSERTPSTIKLLVVCGAVLVAAVVAATFLLVSDLRGRTLADRERELQNLALVIAEQANRAFQAVDLVETSIVDRVASLEIASDEEFRQRLSSYDVHLMLGDKVRGLTYISDFVLFDSKGNLVNLGREWPVLQANIADTRHFQHLKENPQFGLLFSMPVQQRTNGAWAFYLARALVTPQGDFLGILVATVDLQRWGAFFGSVALGKGSSIALLRSDGTMLVRYPRIEQFVGKVFSGFLNALGEKDSASTRLIDAIDHRDRLLAAHRLANYPLAIVAADNVSDVLTGTRWQEDFLIFSAFAAVLAICAILLFIVPRLTHAHRQTQRMLEQRQRRLDAALNNMSQGLCMFNNRGQLVVSNERYRHMYALPGGALRPGLTVAELVELRRKSGTLTGGAQQYYSKLLGRLADGTPSDEVIDLADGRMIRIIDGPVAGGGWVATHEDVTEHETAKRRISHIARHDVLTGLGNRLLFREMLNQALKRTQENRESFGLLLLDLDEFKTVNDSLGHPVGDDLIKEVALRLRRVTRSSDTVARLGGDEFAILHSVDGDQREAATALADRILKAMAEPFELAGHHVTIGVSIGIALAPDDDILTVQLFRKADLALYRAKAEGRNAFRLFEPAMETQACLRHTLGNDLHAALSAGEFEIAYQPIVDAATRRTCSVEALLRWRHPTRGLIGPDAFISMAEDMGLIVPLGEWVLRKACKDATHWPRHVKLAVNLSPTQFRNGNLLEVIKAALDESGLAPNRLELEITESVLMQKSSDSLATLHSIKSLGVSIVLDDFGTGYASLAYLRTFPFDKIKIDRSFVAEMPVRADCAVIIRTIVELGRQLDITTTAEGVETEEQLALLRAAGCDQMQGYLFGCPRPASELNLAGNNLRVVEAPAA